MHCDVFWILYPHDLLRHTETFSSFSFGYILLEMYLLRQNVFTMFLIIRIDPNIAKNISKRWLCSKSKSIIINGTIFSGRVTDYTIFKQSSFFSKTFNYFFVVSS